VPAIVFVGAVASFFPAQVINEMIASLSDSLAVPSRTLYCLQILGTAYTDSRRDVPPP
jgi:hypothetical protein